jgi:hypothetical protein
VLCCLFRDFLRYPSFKSSRPSQIPEIYRKGGGRGGSHLELWIDRVSFYVDYKRPRGERETLIVTGREMARLAANGSLHDLPPYPREEILEKSKADGFSKIIVCLQAGWLVLQVIGRIIEHLPTSTLEITTIAYVACTFINYLFWWNKPVDVRFAVIVKADFPMRTAMYFEYFGSWDDSPHDAFHVENSRAWYPKMTPSIRSGMLRSDSQLWWEALWAPLSGPFTARRGISASHLRPNSFYGEYPRLH